MDTEKASSSTAPAPSALGWAPVSPGGRRGDGAPCSVREVALGATPTIYIVDDDPDSAGELARLFRSAGRSALVFHSSVQFLRAHDPSRAGCLILNVAMPVVDGLAVQQLLQAAQCTRPIIFISAQGTVPSAVRAMKAGAVDFLAKPLYPPALLDAVEEALARDSAQRQARQTRDAILERVATLTGRERDVLKRIVLGRLNKQVAADLGVTEKTVKVHRAQVMRKMGVRSLAQLVSYAEVIGFEEDDDTTAPRRAKPGERESPRSHRGPARRGATVATWNWDIPEDRVTGDSALDALFGVSGVGTDDRTLGLYLRSIHPGDVDRVSSQIRRSMESGLDYAATYRVRSRSAEHLVVARGRTEYDTSGRPIRLPGALVDVTGVRHAVFTELHLAMR